MKTDNSELIKSAVIWGIVAMVLAVIACTFNNSAMVLRAGFVAKSFAVILGTALGTVGALIGDAIRKFAQPDAVFTQGGIGSLIWIRVFWKVGPQLMGLGIGVALGASLVLR